MSKLKNIIKDMKLSLRSLTTTTIFLSMVSIYCVVVVLYNIFELKYIQIADLGWSVFGHPLIIGMGAGTLISWIVFLIMDVITEVWGKKVAVRTFSFATVISIITALIGGLIAAIPGSGPEIDYIFGFQLRIVIASGLAFWVGNYVNTFIMHIMRLKAKETGQEKHNGLFALRAFLSTLFGQFVDNLIFLSLAFGGLAASGFFGPIWTWGEIFGAVLLGTLLELVLESILIPVVTIPLSRKLIDMREKEVKESLVK